MGGRLALAIALLGVAACGKKAGGAASHGGCDRRAQEHLCGEYHGETVDVDWVQAQCTAMAVPYVAACPRAGAIARCVMDAAGLESHTWIYAPMTRETAAALCVGGELHDP
jgi:hypothetical protein